MFPADEVMFNSVPLLSAKHFILSMDSCVLFNLTFCEAQPQQLSEVTVQTDMQFGSFSLDFSTHRIKPLVLVRPRTAEFGYLGKLYRGCEKIMILLINFQQMKKQWLFKSKT